jgi:hypothetical protein
MVFFFLWVALKAYIHTKDPVAGNGEVVTQLLHYKKQDITSSLTKIVNRA